MTQPEHVPVSPADRVRQLEKLPPPVRWRPDRPGETIGGMPDGRRFGDHGPDQGYGLLLARTLEPRLAVAPGESPHDALAGVVAVGLRRASLFHRAPVIYDFELAATVWGLLGEAPEELVAARRRLFEGAGHSYDRQRAVAGAVSEAALRLTPADARAHLHRWSELVSL